MTHTTDNLTALQHHTQRIHAEITTDVELAELDIHAEPVYLEASTVNRLDASDVERLYTCCDRERQLARLVVAL